METRWKDLAPGLIRQRVIIEGTTREIVKPDLMKSYLLQLAKITGMERMRDPIIYSAHECGYGGWQHWRTSGSTIYSYPGELSDNGIPLVTVDTYTCKPFSVQEAAEFTREHLWLLEMCVREIDVTAASRTT
ncbi:MAG: S-adenosylmethionine decarboxylase [Candidatus Woesearchaeota archaeon]|nr:S-adenosylmethionine decarboxylase [Candidatus Woesearchaeota archaeon]